MKKLIRKWRERILFKEILHKIEISKQNPIEFQINAQYCENLALRLFEEGGFSCRFMPTQDPKFHLFIVNY